MDPSLSSSLILLVLFQVKHLFADFFMQTPRMLAGRDEYLHFGRAQHAALHGMFSVLCVMAMGAPLGFILWLCLAETIVHYHIDWGKGVHSARTQNGPTDAGYWRAFGVDQLLHQLTYIAMFGAWAMFAF